MSLPHQFTPFFWTSEFTVTSTGLPNVIPDEETWYSLRALCSAVSVRWRERVGGRAADRVPAETDRVAAWGVLVDLVTAGLPTDQAIGTRAAT